MAKRLTLGYIRAIMNATRAFFLSAALSCTALFAACDDTQAPADDDEDENRPLVKNDGGSSSGGKDASKPATPAKDSGPDAKKDSTPEEPEDAAPDVVVHDGGPTLVEPEPGTACTVKGERFTRPCAPCGSQIAFCTPNMTVSGYGACRSAEGACAPGSTEPGAACGACGVTTRVCNDQCVFQDSTCEGELPTGCVAGRTEQRLASCGTGQTIVYECNAACAWEPQTGAVCTGTPAFPVINIAPSEGTTIDRLVTTGEQIRGPRNFYDDCNALSAQQVYGRVFELINSTAQAATVDVWNIGASTLWDFVFIAYDEPPLAPGDLIPACIATNDVCNVSPYNDLTDACFAGSGAVRIPANGRRWVYVGNFANDDPARAYTLRVKTVDLQ